MPRAGPFDIPMVQALALWTAVLIVVVSALADVVLAVLDPRVRASGHSVHNDGRSRF